MRQEYDGSAMPDRHGRRWRSLDAGATMGQLWGHSSFSLPLNAADTARSGLLGTLALWGSGDYRNFSGGNRQTLGYNGNVLSANVGIDTRLSEKLLVGMAVVRARGTVDYTASNVSRDPCGRAP